MTTDIAWPVLDSLLTEAAGEHPVPPVQWSLAGAVLGLVLIPVHTVALEEPLRNCKCFFLFFFNQMESFFYFENLP